ncbi:ferritin-like domain-containing protein [Aquimarina sp. 2201CG5-10]|uniref:ferritin-like domain-containing protein n=1 Tax=Aquimarina callyspongiae TaxID=3098150 RepID=UPI002AB329F4|nr:ferritin-like domain-containing protein [Aquimarina sp. 2201CG5-10]MDY8136623.1 ferritin-like domain-containing protein [Aquimarina sp. 2201CG5-10]
MYTLPKGELTNKTFSKAMDHAIAIELTTIPCYLSTYYSINRAQDQDALYNKILIQVQDEKIAKELTLDVLVYANKAAALIMSVVVEEMLHLSLSSNVKQAGVAPPDLMKAGKNLTYPTSLFGNPNEFKINRAPLSIDQLISFLKIESPNRFKGDHNDTIGEFYDKIIKYIKNSKIDWRLTDNGYPQLVPTQPYYAQNTINTVYYDRKHNPQFPSADDSGGMVEVKDKGSAITALNEIIEQGEGHKGGDQLEIINGKPKPLPIKDGKVVFSPEDYDDPAEEELSHFAKFMELYTLGDHYEEKFSKHTGLDNFFSYFVYDQAVNPVTDEYSNVLYQQSQLANAIYTYILLMIETCYHQELPTQYEVFMMGIHKSMIWLLSQFGRDVNQQTFAKKTGGAIKNYAGSVTFEYYPFEDQKEVRPKEQIIKLAQKLIEMDSSYGWLFTDPQYLLALPDVGLDHQVNKTPLHTSK